MRAKRIFFSILPIIGLLLSAHVSRASFIPVPPEGTSATLSSHAGASLTYNAATEVFTATTFFPTLGSAATLSTGPSHIVASDIVGSFTVTATIDHLGNVVGGTFTLVGASATLGIASTALLTGNISDGGFSPAFPGLFQLSGGLTSVDPEFGAVVGRIRFAVMDYVGGVNPDLLMADVSIPTASFSPDIYLVLPEPASILLFILGCAAIWALGRLRKQRTTHA